MCMLKIAKYNRNRKVFKKKYQFINQYCDKNQFI